MAAPAFSSATAQGSGTATTTCTVTLPTTAANDILILIAVNGGATATPTLTTGTFTLDTSWALIDSATWTTGMGGAWWVRCSGNHSGQTQIMTGCTDSTCALVVRITGAITTGTPIDQASVTGATLGAVAGGALTGVSTTALETLVCYVGTTDDNQAVSSPTMGGNAMSNLSTAASSGGADSGVWYANSSQAVAGATGNFAVTNPAGTVQGKRVASFAVLSVRQVVLQASTGVSSATLVLSAPTTVPLGSSDGVASPTLALAPFTVASRYFDDVDDYMQTSIGLCNLATSASTFAALVRSHASGELHPIVMNCTSGDAGVQGLEINSSNQIEGRYASFVRPSDLTVTPGDGWVIAVATKAAGTAVPRFHVFKGGSWSHADQPSALTSGDSAAQDRTKFARLSSAATYADIDLAVAGQWNVVLSDSEVEELSANAETLDWLNNSGGTPVGLWNFDQTDVATDLTDLTGNGADETTIVGTTVIYTGPTGWDYATAVAAEIPLSPASGVCSATLALTAPAVFGLRRNLVANPSFEVDTASWSQNQATGALTRVTSEFYFGTASGQQVNPGTNIQEGIFSYGLATATGTIYTASVYVKATAGKHLMLALVDGGGADTTTWAASGSWERKSLTRTAGGTSMTAYVIHDAAFAAEAATVYMDGFLVEQGGTVGDYFDGNTPSAVWEGTGNDSVSTYGTLVSSGQSSATLSITTPAIIASGYRLGVKALGPGMSWPLDATYGVTDQSGNGRDGSGAGSISIGGFASSPIAGEITSTEFDGSDDGISVASYSPFAGVRSFVGWAYHDVADTEVLLLDDTGNVAAQVAPSTPAVGFYEDVGGGFVQSWTYDWPENEWVHFAFVIDDPANEASFYVNGALNFTWTTAFTWRATASFLRLGNYPGQFWDGKMAHFAVFERALTANEVSTLYTLKNYPPLTASGQSSATLDLTIPMGPIPLAAASGQSSATLSLTAPARLSLTVSGVSSTTLSLTAPTRVVLAASSAVSTATLTLTAAAKVVLAPATCVSSATLNLAQYVPLGSAVCVSSATLNLTAVARLSLTVSGQSSATLFLTALTRIPLVAASSVSSASLTLTALTRITLQAASAVASPTLALTAPTRVTLGTASCISNATLALTAKPTITLAPAACISSATLAVKAPAKVVLGTAACQSSATLSLFAPGGGLVPLNSVTTLSSATLILKAQTRVPLGAASGISSASLALKAQARVLLASSDGTSAATLVLTALTQIPFAPVFALSDGSLVVTIPAAAVEIVFDPADGLSSATLVVTAPTVAPPEPEPEPTYDFTLRRILTTYPVGTEVGVYEGEPDVYDNYGMRRLPPVEPVQTLTVEADPFTISNLTEGNYFTIGTYQRRVRPRGDPDFETVMQTISFRVP